MQKSLLDRLGRPVKVGDIVSSYNSVYEVLNISPTRANCILVNPSKTTRSKYLSQSEMVYICSGEEFTLLRLADKDGLRHI